MNIRAPVTGLRLCPPVRLPGGRTGPDALPDRDAVLRLADREPGLLVPAQDFHHGEQRPRESMQYYRRSAFSQPDDGPHLWL